MIQFNLLPDVKLEYIKATYKRRIVSLISAIVAGAFLFVFILMFVFVRVNQANHLKDLDKDINESVSSLRASNPDLDKILTIQNQLNSLPELHDKKVISSRIFDYLIQVTPNQASLTGFELDLENKKISIKGTADSVQTVNKFVDTLKFTEYSLEGDPAGQNKAFKSVVLQAFKIDPQATSGKAISYEINAEYEENIFKNTAKEGNSVANGVTLTVPKIITTRSETQKPTNLFQEGNQNQNQQGGQ